MKKLTLLAVVLAASAAAFLSSEPAECYGCFDVLCVNSAGCAGPGCVCLKHGSNPTGRCVSINNVP